MEIQLIINGAFGVIFVGLGWFLKGISDAVRDLQSADKELTDKVSKIEILVAGEYVKVDKFDQMVNAIFAKLDRIEEKLSQKADK